jgi:hypothetical protein
MTAIVLIGLIVLGVLIVLARLAEPVTMVIKYGWKKAIAMYLDEWYRLYDKTEH